MAYSFYICLWLTQRFIYDYNFTVTYVFFSLNVKVYAFNSNYSHIASRKSEAIAHKALILLFVFHQDYSSARLIFTQNKSIISGVFTETYKNDRISCGVNMTLFRLFIFIKYQLT
jgi:hypothetical protein